MDLFEKSFVRHIFLENSVVRYELFGKSVVRHFWGGGSVVRHKFMCEFSCSRSIGPILDVAFLWASCSATTHAGTSWLCRHSAQTQPRKMLLCRLVFVSCYFFFEFCENLQPDLWRGTRVRSAGICSAVSTESGEPRGPKESRLASRPQRRPGWFAR